MAAHGVKFEELSDYDQGWVVGLLEGEGSFSSKNGNRRRRRVEMGSSDLDVMEKYRTLVSPHRVIRTYQPKGERVEGGAYKPSHRLVIYGDEAERLMKDMYPYLSAHRQSQIDEALSRGS